MSTASAPANRAAHGAIELLVEALAGEDVNLDRREFYSRLAESVSRLAAMRRVLIFRFDEVTHRVEAAGAYAVDLELFAGHRVGLESAPVAGRALAEDRVIEVRPPEPHEISSEFAELVGEHPIVYVPMAAGGRWPGVILAEPALGSPPLDDSRREVLWMLGKTLALASTARTATFHSEHAMELERRIALARDLHERVVQRLFGVSMALSPAGPLDNEARERCSEEVGVALGDLRSALTQPLGPSPKPTTTTLAAELDRLAKVSSDFRLSVDGRIPEVPASLEPLAQSVLAEAVRNVRKHSRARSIVVRVRRNERLLVLEVENDGLTGKQRFGPPGVGLRIAALEAMQVGGMLEFGERPPGVWQVRLAVPEGGR
ncbi:MAG TPA: hypothetical protein VGF81_12250 [Solirubrobacteraceae bacterium]